MSKALIDHAKGRAVELHGKIKAAVDTMNATWISLARMLREVRDKQLHRHIPKPGSRKSFVSFREYVESLGFSGTHAFELVSIAGLLEGPNAIPEADVAQMPKANARKLTRLKPERITRAIVDAAKATKPRDLPAKLVELGVPRDEAGPDLFTFVRQWPREIIELAERVEEEAQFIDGLRDGDDSWTLGQKAIHLALLEFLETHEPEIERGKRHAMSEAKDANVIEEENQIEDGEPEGEVVPPGDEEVYTSSVRK